MSPCIGCHAGCCRAFAVPVTGADIVRIQRELGWSFADFVCRWEDREGQIGAGVAPEFRFADEPATPFVICLKQDASQHLANSTKCRFLVEQGPTPEHPLGMASCGIYGIRPSVCRVFPTRLSEKGPLAILHDIPQHGRPSDPNPAYTLCRHSWSLDDIDPIAALQDLTVMQFELKFFQQLAAAWNQVVGPWEAFPEFLLTVYESRVIRETPEGLTAQYAGPHVRPQSKAA